MKQSPISAILRSQVFHYSGMLALSFIQFVLVSFLCNFKLSFFWSVLSVNKSETGSKHNCRTRIFSVLLNLNITVGSFLPGFSFPLLAAELFSTRLVIWRYGPFCMIMRPNPCSPILIFAFNAAINVCWEMFSSAGNCPLKSESKILLVQSVISFFSKRFKETFEQALYPFLIVQTVKPLTLNCFSR